MTEQEAVGNQGQHRGDGDAEPRADVLRSEPEDHPRHEDDDRHRHKGLANVETEMTAGLERPFQTRDLASTWNDCVRGGAQLERAHRPVRHRHLGRSSFSEVLVIRHNLDLFRAVARDHELELEAVAVEREVAEIESRGKLAVIALAVGHGAVGRHIDLFRKGLPDAPLVDDLDPWFPDAFERKAPHSLGRRRQALVPPLQHHEDIGGEALVGAVDLRHIEQKEGAADSQRLAFHTRSGAGQFF